MSTAIRCVALAMLSIGSASGQSPLVDHHQHLFSPMVLALSPAAARGFVPITAKDLVALMDSAGIRRALVLSLGYQYGNPNIAVEDEYANPPPKEMTMFERVRNDQPMSAAHP